MTKCLTQKDFSKSKDNQIVQVLPYYDNSNMLNWLLRKNIYAFKTLLSYLDYEALDSLCYVDGYIESFISSLLNELWLRPNSFSEKSFILALPRYPTALVSDETVVCLAIGWKVLVFSLETGLLITEIVIPGIKTFWNNNITKMGLNKHFLIVFVSEVNKLIFIKKPFFKIVREVKFSSSISCMQISNSYVVVGDSHGNLKVFHNRFDKIDFTLSYPPQTEVFHLDHDDKHIIVSCNSKLLLWNLPEGSLEKDIERPNSEEVCKYTGLVTKFSGTEVYMSYPTVITPAFGPGKDIEVWDINMGVIIQIIDADFDYLSLRYPIINLELCCGMVINHLYDISSYRQVKQFSDKLEEICPQEDKPLKHSVLTKFHHVSVGKHIVDHYQPTNDCYLAKLIVRSFRPT